MASKSPFSFDEKARLIEILLRQAFPFTWAPPPIQLRTGGYPGRDIAKEIKSHDDLMARINDERMRLRSLTDDDLSQLAAVGAAKAKAKRDSELEKLDEVFNAPENAANFEYWLKAEYWTLKEAVALLLGKDPKKLPLLLLSSHLKSAPFVRQHAELMELAQRASVMQASRLRPVDVVEWADSISVDVPKELRDLRHAAPGALAPYGILPQPDRLAVLNEQVRAQRQAAEHAARRVPDWELWGEMRRLRLWQAVALTLDINPGPPDMTPAAAEKMRRPGELQRLGRDFERRLAIAQSNFSSTGPLVPLEMHQGVLQDPCAMVSMDNFLTFVRGLRNPWSLPPAMSGEPRPDLMPEPSTSPTAATPEPSQHEETSPAQQPRFSMARAALVMAHKGRWPTIESDLKDASKNGLAQAKAGPRDWDEARALEWARARGKLAATSTPATASLDSAMRNLSQLPSQKHTLKG